jgi:hypothetical protein
MDAKSEFTYSLVNVYSVLDEADNRCVPQAASGFEEIEVLWRVIEKYYNPSEFTERLSAEFRSAIHDA